jgi:carbon-monoxide dehydrogenase large subunit
LTAQEQVSVEQEPKIIGAEIERVDARVKVTGRALYTRDLRIPYMLHGKIKRSPYPHARIISIDTTKAREIPGVRAVITAKDFPVREGVDTPVLAYDEVLYVNQSVAAVAAESQKVAEMAVEAIRVDYEELPAVFDPEVAMSDNPPTVLRHPGEKTVRPNVARHLPLRSGNVEESFARADFVVENKYTTSPESHFQMEPLSFMAQPEPNGIVTLWCVGSGAHRIRAEVARYLGVDPHSVRVKVTFLGGYFGPKDELVPASICAMLALKTNRPVKLDLSREESVAASAVRAASVIRIKDGVMKDGKIVARQITAVYNGGAYSSLGSHVLGRGALAATDVYNIPNMKMDLYRVYTNQLPNNPKRAPIGTQMVWGVESQMDYLASLLKIDRVKFRLLNTLHNGDTNVLGEKMENISSEESLLEVSRRIRLNEKRPPSGPWRLGKGIALAAKWSGGGVGQAWVQVTDTGRVILSVDVVENGQGTYTGITQLAAAEFGISPSDVILLPLINGSDSAVSGLGPGATASRQMSIAGSAVIAACRDAKRKVVEVAAKRLGCSPTDLDVRGKRIHRHDNPAWSMEISDLFTQVPLEAVEITSAGFVEDGDLVGYGTKYRKIGKQDSVTGKAVGGRLTPYYVTVAQAAEVSVNIETGQIKVHKIVASMDVGKAINPTLVRGQIAGSVAMGLNAALTEEVVFTSGRVANANLADYKLISTVDAPEIETIIFETPFADGPYGAKSAGEPSMLPTAAAVRNAVHDAVGVWINDMPMTPERVLDALRNAKKQS